MFLAFWGEGANLASGWLVESQGGLVLVQGRLIGSVAELRSRKKQFMDLDSYLLSLWTPSIEPGLRTEFSASQTVAANGLHLISK